MQPVALKFLAHGFRRKIGDVADHSCQCETDSGALRLVIILAVVKKRIAANGVSSHDIKRQSLTGQSRRTGQHHRAAQPVGMPRSPGQHLMSADGTADDSDELVDAKVIQQPALDFHHVADGDGWKIRAVRFARRRVQAARSGGAATTTEEIWTDDKKTVRVHRLARPDENVPPARIVFGVVAGNVRVTADGMADQNGIVGGFVKLAVSFKSHRDVWQCAARFQTKQFVKRDTLRITQRLRGANRVAAFKNVLGH